MRAAVAMGADIDHEGAVRRLDLVGAEQKQHIERAERRHLRRAQAASARRKADIERADPRGRIVQHRKTVPAVLDRADIERQALRQREDRGSVMPPSRPGADQHDRILGALQHVGEGMLAGGEIGKGIRARRRDSRSRM